MFFSSGIVSGPSQKAPWTPWIDIKTYFLDDFFDFRVIFSFSTCGQLQLTIWTYKSMLGSLQIEDFDFSFTLS